MRSIINFFWRFFKWGLALGVVAALVATPYLFRHVDEFIRVKVETKIAQNYPNLSVRIRSAQLIDGQGIEVRGLSIVEPAAAGPQAELVYIDEMMLGCDTSLKELAKGEPKITHVKIRRPILRSTRRPDGSWSMMRLLPLPRLGGSLVSGVIENGTVEVFDPLRNPSTTVTMRDVQVSFRPSELPGVDASGAVIDPKSRGQRWLDLQGAFTSDQVQRVQITGKVDLDSQRWGIEGAIDGLQVGPEFFAGVPGISPEWLERFAALRGEARVRFRAHRDQDMPAPLHYEIDAELTRGRIDDPRLPYPLNDVRAHLVATPAGLKIDDFTARNGETLIKLSLERRGWTAESPLMLAAEGSHLRLDRQIARILPESVAIEWYKFLPEGELHAKLNLTYEAGKWKPKIEARLLNVAFSYSKFPYRLERAAGAMTLNDDLLSINLTAYSGSQPVRIHGELRHPGPHYTGFIDIDGDNLAFDDRLLAALPDQSRGVVRALRPQGQFHFTGRIWRDDPNRPKPHEQFQLRLMNCAMNYEKFPYPLQNIRGTIELHDGSWQFRNLEGRNDTAEVHCQGTLTPDKNGGHRLALAISADNVPLEEELRDALSPQVQHLWMSLKPRGSCDLSADVTYTSTDKRFGLTVDARPRPDTTSIEPVAFPYRLEKLRGAIRYQDGHVAFDSIEAAHGRTSVSSAGFCDFLPDGRWTLQFKKLAVDRIKFDHELVAALPEGLRKAIIELKPNAPINVRGAFGIARGATADAPLTSQWELTVDLSQMTVDPGVKLENIYGAVHLAGAFDGERFHSRGELALDSLTYKNYQFTQVLGPLWIDNTRLLLGAWAESKQTRGPRSVTARIFGGTALADCQVMFAPTPQFHLRASLSDGDLAQFAQEHLVGEQALKGKVLANIQLQGNNKGSKSLLGDGVIRLHDADVYELPAMVQLLKILSVRAPGKTAFTQSDIDFRIQGDYLIFDRINFKGDAISLLGRGQMNLDTQVNLTFRAEIGRGDWQLPVVRTVLSEASNQVMQIHVDGTLDHPNIRREAFPGVNQALQQLQADLQNPANPQPAAPQARRLLPPLLRRQ